MPEKIWTTQQQLTTWFNNRSQIGVFGKKKKTEKEKSKDGIKQCTNQFYLLQYIPSIEKEAIQTMAGINE